MRGKKMTLVAMIALVAAAAIGLVALAQPVAAACPPVACPAIAKICPQGQLACRVSPCSCALACVPEGQCNN
jgi:hypothetical protein